MATYAVPFYTPEEYLELDFRADGKMEYYAGKIFAMAGGSPEHSAIGANLLIALGPPLRGSGCRAFNSDLRVQAGPLFTYPDATIVCGQPQYTGSRADTLTNPTVIFEVLSESTEAYDRGDKFGFYREIPSLCEYVLVAQNRPRLERFLRQSDGTWNLAIVEGTDASLPLVSLGCELELAEVYENIVLPSVPLLSNRSPLEEKHTTSGA